MNAELITTDKVEVLLPRPFHHGFDYRVPEEMVLHVGDYVAVPFGRQTLHGVVWGEAKSEIEASKCKPIQQHHAHIKPMSKTMRDFIKWTASYTMAEIGSVMKMAISVPKAFTHIPSEEIYHLADPSKGKITPARSAIIKLLGKASATANEMVEKTGCSKAVLASMIKAGMLTKTERQEQELADQFPSITIPDLYDEQQQAANAMRAMDGFDVSVLNGVTGSGKTEVYFDTIAKTLREQEGQVLVLLPEIALATQWLNRFKERFGQEPTVWHSSVSDAKRRDGWRRVANGKARLVVGARSALYLPFQDLRLIIVDEEHESSYKQDDGVCYHARDMAVARAKLEDIPVVLVSATPSLETVANIEADKYKELIISSRYKNASLPETTLIDLRSDKPDSGQFLSYALKKELLTNLGAGYQSMLFLNRRGYAPLLLCRSCGYRFECDQCSAWMVQHKASNRLECHHCGNRKLIPKACPECGETEELAACGPGVERVVEELSNSLPQARVAQLTSDESNVAGTIKKILNQEVDIIVGTQMIAKGHHFPNLALVGVVDADLGLRGGDLRASERTFQLLHQLSGRAGRENVRGHVYLQTVQPEHPVMQALAAGDRDGFIEEEIKEREAAGWPPYGRLAALLLDGANASQVNQSARQLVLAAPKDPNVRLLGPAPAPLSKLRNQYRVRILVKASKSAAIQTYLRDWFARASLPNTVRLKIDIDPYNFL